nr:sigma-E factor negative regulatory protein [Methylomarinum sp. Ch1-1]MDP4519940.1 sigma-E factor negative regulatory protein [Methylomarinum sp. Ch1-1]
MQEECNKTISQFIDDELDLQQAISLMQGVQKETALRNKLNRYQVISQVLKSEQVVVLKDDFVEQISAQIKEEPVYLLPSRKAMISWKKLLWRLPLHWS